MKHTHKAHKAHKAHTKYTPSYNHTKHTTTHKLHTNFTHSKHTKHTQTQSTNHTTAHEARTKHTKAHEAHEAHTLWGKSLADSKNFANRKKTGSKSAPQHTQEKRLCVCGSLPPSLPPSLLPPSPALLLSVEVSEPAALSSHPHSSVCRFFLE